MIKVQVHLQSFERTQTLLETENGIEYSLKVMSFTVKNKKRVEMLFLFEKWQSSFVLLNCKEANQVHPKIDTLCFAGL